MDNKSLKLVFNIFFILFLLNIVYAQDLNSSDSSPKVAYIFKSKPIIDKNIFDVFNNSGFLVDFIHESSLPMNLSKYRFIYIGDEAFSKNLPIDEYPSIVSSYFIGYKGGLTDRDGISRLVARQPLKVSVDGRLLQVYTKAEDKGYSIDYYYLDKDNKAPVFKKRAGTYSTSSGVDFGDVVSYADKGSILSNGKIAKGDICFFGIVESDYWTSSAKELFLDCMGFVNKYTPFIDNNETNQTNNQTNNTSIACSSDLDCGADGFIGLNSCLDNKVVKNYISFKCINPGNITSYCSNNTELRVVNNCSFCSNGSCSDVRCSSDLDCDDKNPLTLDSCSNPGTLESICYHNFISNNQTNQTTNNQTNNTVISCSNDLECDDKNLLTLDSCSNPGTMDSVCVHEIQNKFVISSLAAEVRNTSVILYFYSNYSGIKGYYVSNNKSSWIWVLNNNYTFSNLFTSTNYTFFVKAKDMTDKLSKEVNISVKTLSASVDNSGGSGGGSSGGGGGSGSGGGSGGGSGSSSGVDGSNVVLLSNGNGNHRGIWCITEWNCSDWSKCVNNKQKRVCSYPSNFCEPYDPKPTEEQSCVVSEESTYSSDLNNKEIPDSNNNIGNLKKPFFPITGAAIAAVITEYPWIALGILLVFLAVGYYLTNKYYFIPKKKVHRYTPLKRFFKLFY